MFGLALDLPSTIKRILTQLKNLGLHDNTLPKVLVSGPKLAVLLHLLQEITGSHCRFLLELLLAVQVSICLAF